MRRVMAVMLPVTVAVTVGLVGCSSSNKGTAPTTSAAPITAARSTSISIKNFSFSPVALDIKATETVTITNNDGTDHTFSADAGAFDTGHIAPGTSKTVTINNPGSYSYHCNIHPTMKGVVQVGP
jgi:plastocyanin